MSVEAEHDQAEVAALDEGFTKPELQKAADDFGVETKKAFSKPDLINALLNDGVNATLVRAAAEKEAEDAPDEDEDLEIDVPAPVEEEDDSDLVLVKMVRANNTYEIRGYRFTQEHPFALVTEGAADYLIEQDGGFSLASPKEAAAYYS